MNDKIQKRLNQIQTENNIWILYLIIIGLSFYSNYLEKDYFLKKNEKSKEKYRKLNIIIFTTLTAVYCYFEKEAITSVQEKDKTKTQEKYDNLAFIASTLILISGIIFLYIVIVDKDIEEEVAFN